MPSTNLPELYKAYYGPIGQQWDNVRIKDYSGRLELLNGVSYYMPTRIQISQPGAAESLFRMPNEPLIGVQFDKVIIKTPIDSQDGTFKEGFAIDDYKITMRGLIVNEDDTSEDYPEELIRKIRRVCEIKGSLKIENDLLAIFGIDRVVITSVDFPDFPGSPSTQPYVISMLSDKEFELELKRK